MLGFFSTPIAFSTLHLAHVIEHENRSLTLEDFLTFVSGANRIPPTGFEKLITIDFNDTFLYPTASTCRLTMYLPTKFDTYSDFKSAMIEGLVSGFGFGQP